MSARNECLSNGFFSSSANPRKTILDCRCPRTIRHRYGYGSYAIIIVTVHQREHGETNVRPEHDGFAQLVVVTVDRGGFVRRLRCTRHVAKRILYCLTTRAPAAISAKHAGNDWVRRDRQEYLPENV